ncbi:anti-sigma factor [Halalkalibacter oceani]|uniref:Anti-sigma factor n=1 Tax=Halalkalibacter oceani TaxID=1653776 RepID=A0A9X2IPS7_9BACI|nr:anti-sigma factor [Halalkalibacter oceani]MCM3716329.1 anti-sigma factor [Halalkalibacter oceani]
MSCHNHFSEEQIIDYLRGEAEDEASVKQHLDHCPHCQQLQEQWKPFFAKETEAHIRPPERLKKRILHTIRTEQRKPFFHFLTLRPLTARFSLVVIVLLLGSWLTISQVQKTSLQHSAEEPLPFLMNEETTLYEISPEDNTAIKGYAWINNDSNELMLLVDGLHPVSLNDYQAWIRSTTDLKDAGIIQVNGAQGQLYLQDDIVNQLDHIILSKEPRGGSIQPTDPNPFLIKLSMP